MMKLADPAAVDEDVDDVVDIEGDEEDATLEVVVVDVEELGLTVVDGVDELAATVDDRVEEPDLLDGPERRKNPPTPATTITTTTAATAVVEIPPRSFCIEWSPFGYSL